MRRERTPSRLLSAKDYRRLAREIHRLYGKPLGMPYWESSSLADSVNAGEFTKKRLFELLDDAVADELEAPKNGT